MNATVLASSARILHRLLEHHGIDPAFVYREVGLDLDLVRDPRARYAGTKVRAAWQMATRLIDSPCFGLLTAEVWRPTDFHALGYAFLSSYTLKTAIQRIVRYHAIVDTAVKFDATLDDSYLRLTYEITDPDIPNVFALQDARLAGVFGLCREAYGPSFSAAAVSFTHPAPSCHGDYYGLFRCPVQFDAPKPELVLDRAMVEAPLPAASRELAVANEAILADYLRTLVHDDIVSRVKTAVIAHLPSGTPSAEAVAKELHMSIRTLHRRLSQAQTSFSETLEAVRRELAEQYISDPTRSLSEISFLLGFSEQSAFSRAFRRWTGQPPSTFRDAAG
jgi:AraC-like DNA-binding protein